MKLTTRILACTAVMALMLGLNARTASAIPGWDVVIQDNFGEGGIGGTIDNINEAETLLDLGGAPEATEVANVINYQGEGGGGSIAGDNAFPGGFGATNDFALRATGFVMGLPGDYASVRVGVNSDDGFRARVNGTVVGEFVNPRGPGDTFFDVAVANGDQIQLDFFERAGGDEVELFMIDPATGVRTLIDGSVIDTAATPLANKFALANRDILGFNATIQTVAGGGVFGNGDALIDDVNEAEQLLLNGGAPEAEAVSLLPVFGQNGSPFPAGATADDFAMRLTGVVDVLDASGSEELFLYVNSDDGFRLRVNGDLISEFVGLTGGSNTMSGLITLNDGDLIDIVYFERGGGEFFSLSRDFDGQLGTAGDRVALGGLGSGVRILTQAPAIPEPTTAILGLLGLAGMGLRRRRNAA